MRATSTSTGCGPTPQSRRRKWAIVPVGAKPNGELQNVVLRAKDFGGFGFHSVVIGTSGSGKSEFPVPVLRNRADALAGDLQRDSVDMKFESAAQDLGFHTSRRCPTSARTNGTWPNGCGAIDGEIARRYRLFNSAGARDANEYEEIDSPAAIWNPYRSCW